jgi:DNA-binding GntR family transcriptional regulator
MKSANDVVDDCSAIDLKERSDSLVGRIAADVARAITEGRLAPGADLNSVELAARFGTSRTPVREALMLLEKEGLVEIPPRRRPRVSLISLGEIEELYQIRSALNGLMITSFVRRADEEQLLQMIPLHEQIKRYAYLDDDAFQASRRALHNYWLDNCGNGSLRDLLSTWKMRMSVGRLVKYQAEDIERSLRDHDRLVTACQDRDEALAVALLQSMTLSGLAAIKRQHRDWNS